MLINIDTDTPNYQYHMLVHAVCSCILLFSRPCGAGKEDHGSSGPALPGHPLLGPGDLRRPVEGHGSADAPDSAKL